MLSTIAIGHESLVVDRRANVAAFRRTTRQFDQFRSQILIGDLGQQVPDAVKVGTFFVLCVHYEPVGLLGIGVRHHLIFRTGIVLPTSTGFNIHRTQLPALGGIMNPVLEASFLFLVAHRKPILDQDNTRPDQHAFEFRAGMKELFVFGIGAKTHHSFDTRTIVPTSVKQDHLSGSRKERNITLEVPLRFFSLRGNAQSRDATDARVHPLNNAFDGATFASSVTPFEENHHLKTFVLDPFLQLNQFNLKPLQFLFVPFALNFMALFIGGGIAVFLTSAGQSS